MFKNCQAGGAESSMNNYAMFTCTFTKSKTEDFVLTADEFCHDQRQGAI